MIEIPVYDNIGEYTTICLACGQPAPNTVFSFISPLNENSHTKVAVTLGTLCEDHQIVYWAARVDDFEYKLRERK